MGSILTSTYTVKQPFRGWLRTTITSIQPQGHSLQPLIWNIHFFPSLSERRNRAIHIPWSKQQFKFSLAPRLPLAHYGKWAVWVFCWISRGSITWWQKVDLTEHQWVAMIRLARGAKDNNNKPFWNLNQSLSEKFKNLKQVLCLLQSKRKMITTLTSHH